MHRIYAYARLHTCPHARLGPHARLPPRTLTLIIPKIESCDSSLQMFPLLHRVILAQNFTFICKNKWQSQGLNPQPQALELRLSDMLDGSATTARLATPTCFF